MVRRPRLNARRSGNEAVGSKASDRPIGLLWLAGGVAITAFTYAASGPGGFYLVARGPMLYGVIKIAGAIADAHGEDGASPPYRERVALGQEMTLRAMLFVADAAGGHDGARGAAIEAILWRITDTEFPADRKAAIVAEMDRQDDGFLDAVRSQRQAIPPSFHDIMLSASAEIALAGGALHADAETRLRALAEALRLSSADADAAIAAARASARKG